MVSRDRKQSRSGNILMTGRTAIYSTNLEAYLDMYLATDEQRYRDGVHGAWEIYRAHWQQVGGSISIIEFEKDPPDSNYLRQKLGEMCGSSFWVFLSQRFQLLQPDDERYATEIEKSIYNIGMANQDGSLGLRYHTIMEGKKRNLPMRIPVARPGHSSAWVSPRAHILHRARRNLFKPLRTLHNTLAARWSVSKVPT
jgi:hypothetical protein